MSKMKIFVVILAIGILAAGSYVYATGEKALRETPAADVSPERGDLRATPPVESSQILAYGDELAYFRVEAQVNDFQILGIAFDGSYMWLTGGGSGGTNMLYKFDAAGSFMLSFIQASPAGWGWRDLCYEAATNKLWGSASGIIQEINPITGLATGASIPSPVNPARAEAWQPPGTNPGPESGQTGTRGYIWTGSFSGNLYRVCVATGVADGPYSNSWTVYGAAWNDCDDCPPDEKLWWTDQNTLYYYNMDPTTRSWNSGLTIHHPSFGYSGSPPYYGPPGGLGFAQGVGGVPEWSSGALYADLGVLLGVCQCPVLPDIGDAVWAYELCAEPLDWDAAVQSLTVTVSSLIIDVVVANMGINTIPAGMATVSVEVKEGATVVFTGTASTTVALDNGDTETLTFTWDDEEECKTYNTEACVELDPSIGPDENPGNDCKSATTVVLPSAPGYFNDFETACCLDGQNSWECGTPSYGGINAYSGTKCWGTNLSGTYGNNACDSLRMSFVATGDNPVLKYYHYHNIEGTWDGYTVFMSVNGGPVVPITPTSPAYNYGYSYGYCYGGPNFSGFSSWTQVRFDLNGVVAGDVMNISIMLTTDASVPYPGVYVDDLETWCMEFLPPEYDLDLDVDDDYANLVANKMTLVGTRSKKTVLSHTMGYFVVVNPDNDINNVDYWDGPSMDKMNLDAIDYAADTLYCYHHKKPKEAIPSENITFAPPQSTLDFGDAMLVALDVMIPSKAKHIKHDEEKYTYRGTVTVTGTAGGECGAPSTTEDKFTLNVKVVKGDAGVALPNSFVGNWDEKGVTLSWGNFDFGQSYNLYRANELGEFVRLNSTAMPGNSNYVDEKVVEGATYQYKFGVILESGEEVVFGPMTAALTRRPAHASLMPSQPNPVNTETVIRYALANDADVSLKIYDVSGSLVKTLVNEPTMAGYHSVVWNATNEANEKVANGVYFYRLTAGDFAKSHKLVVLK